MTVDRDRLRQLATQATAAHDAAEAAGWGWEELAASLGADDRLSAAARTALPELCDWLDRCAAVLNAVLAPIDWDALRSNTADEWKTAAMEYAAAMEAGRALLAELRAADPTTTGGH